MDQEALPERKPRQRQCGWKRDSRQHERPHPRGFRLEQPGDGDDERHREARDGYASREGLLRSPAEHKRRGEYDRHPTGAESEIDQIERNGNGIGARKACGDPLLGSQCCAKSGSGCSR